MVSLVQLKTCVFLSQIEIWVYSANEISQKIWNTNTNEYVHLQVRLVPFVKAKASLNDQSLELPLMELERLSLAVQENQHDKLLDNSACSHKRQCKKFFNLLFF
jgi:hypothetical protein